MTDTDTDNAANNPFPYGFCPICGSKGVMRERRPNGNDKCANGHSYKSSDSQDKPEPKREESGTIPMQNVAFDHREEVKFQFEQSASRSALELVVSDFNPSHDSAVGRIKLLTAALITECEKLRDRPLLPEGMPEVPDVPAHNRNKTLRKAARWAAIAISQYEEAAMFAVKAITAK